MLRRHFDAVFLLRSLWCEYCLVPFSFCFHLHLKKLATQNNNKRLAFSTTTKSTHKKEEAIVRRDQNKNIELRKLRMLSVCFFVCFLEPDIEEKTSAFLVMPVTWHAWHVLAVLEDTHCRGYSDTWCFFCSCTSDTVDSAQMFFFFRFSVNSVRRIGSAEQ